MIEHCSDKKMTNKNDLQLKPKRNEHYFAKITAPDDARTAEY